MSIRNDDYHLRDLNDGPQSSQSLPKTPLLSTREIDENSASTKRGWRPWTLTAKVLVPTAIFTALLIVALALLQWQNARHGALFFSQTADGFSNWELFLFRYLPNIIIVLYGVLWSWIDLDIKRLEPWFQMADIRGVDGANSLLLQYPMEFLPLVPYKAARRKQWVVVSTSTIMLTVVWAVTPLQNGIFATSVIDLDTPVTVSTTNSLAPLEDQMIGLNGAFMMAGYGITWLGQKPPAFTTDSYALAPFQDWKETGETIPVAQNQTITGPTMQYQTSLECAPPVNISVIEEFSGFIVAFDDGKGCKTDPIVPIRHVGLRGTFGKWSSYYIGYWDDPALQRDLELAQCPRSSNHTFLAVWARNTNSTPKFNTASGASALFCTPSYHKQLVNATVKLSDLSVLSTLPLGPKAELSEDLFNATHFEYLLGVGVPSKAFIRSKSQGDPARFTDASNTLIVHQDTQLRELGVGVPTDNMVGYAVGLADRNPNKLTEPGELQRAFERAHQLLFALAVHDILPVNGSQSAGAGLVHSTLQAVRVVPVFALLTEALLIVILLFTIYLLWSSPRRRNYLTSDPDSLAEIMSMGGDPKVQCLLERSDTVSEKELAIGIGAIRFCLEPKSSGAKPRLRMAEEYEVTKPFGERSPDHQLAPMRVVRPTEYNWFLGLPFILTLTAMIAGLIFLRRKGQLENGLALPATSDTVQNLLTNALPALLATLLEPFWILLNRVACIMRPMEELRKGATSAQRSLLLKYNSIPPQLNIWRALRTRHMLLVILSSIAILANVLTVAFSGLFNQNAVFHGQAVSLQPTLLPRTSPDLQYMQDQSIGNNTFGDAVADAYLVALSNFTGGASLQPWVSPHYYFLPLDDTNSDNSTNKRYRLQSVGYGAELKCDPVTTSPSDITVKFRLNDTATELHITSSYKQANGSVIQCKPFLGVNGFVGVGGIPEGRKGFELAGSQTAVGNIEGNTGASGLCSNTILKGWIRGDLKMEPLANKNQSTNPLRLQPVTINNLASSFISCQPRLKSALFNLTISPNGAILEAKQTNDPVYDNPSTNLTYLLRETGDLLSGRTTDAGYFWHNGSTATNDLVQQMIKALTNNTAFLDPTLPLPDFATTASTLSDLYARLFAIQLSLRSALLLPAERSASPVQGQFETFQTRLFMSETMFHIALTILCLDLLVAMIFYVRAPAAFLPRLPTTIASQLAFFAGSHALEDVRAAGGDLRMLDRKGYRYGYGRFVGVDGRVHVGVERVPYVIPLKQKRTRLGVRWLGGEGRGLRNRWGLKKRGDEDKGEASA